MRTQKEINERQKELRRLNNNLYTKKYEKTHSGFLVRLYRNMKSRVSGVQKEKFYLYKGLDILPKEEFYKWAKTDIFYKMFKRWKISGYDRKLTPSVNRINPKIGYILGNMEWLTHSENSRLGSTNANKRFTQK